MNDWRTGWVFRRKGEEVELILWKSGIDAKRDYLDGLDGILNI